MLAPLLILTGVLDGVAPPVAPTVEPVRPSGGIPHDYVPSRKDVSRARKKFGLDDGYEKAMAVVNSVAARQVEALELDQQKIFEELLRSLELEGITFETRYLEALARQRELLIDEEIGRLLREKQKRDDEEVLLMILMASAV